MSNKPKLPRGFELQDIEEIEYALRIREQLSRIRVFLLTGDADDEMVDTVDYLIEDNDRWISPEIEKDLSCGQAARRRGIIGEIIWRGSSDQSKGGALAGRIARPRGSAKGSAEGGENWGGASSRSKRARERLAEISANAAP